MAKGLVGNVYKNSNNEDYIILEEINFKNILCVYAMKVLENDEEGEKNFYQVDKTAEEISLVDIHSKKMLNSLTEALNQKSSNQKPRKIKENESIQAYLDYLDNFYRQKIGANV